MDDPQQVTHESQVIFILISIPVTGHSFVFRVVPGPLRHCPLALNLIFLHALASAFRHPHHRQWNVLKNYRYINEKNHQSRWTNAWAHFQKNVDIGWINWILGFIPQLWHWPGWARHCPFKSVLITTHSFYSGLLLIPLPLHAVHCHWLSLRRRRFPYSLSLVPSSSSPGAYFKFLNFVHSLHSTTDLIGISQ